MNLLHLWLVHAPVWMALILAADVHKNGAPQLGGLPKLIASAGLLGSLMGILTAHAHGHYLAYVKDLI